MSVQVYNVYRDRDINLVKQKLTDVVVTDISWWRVLKIKSRLISVAFIKEALEETKLVAKLDEGICSSIAIDVLAARRTFRHVLNVKYEGYVVRDKIHALKHGGTKAV